MASTIGYSDVYLPPPAANPGPATTSSRVYCLVLTIGGAPGGPYKVVFPIPQEPPPPPNIDYEPPPGQYIISKGYEWLTFPVSTRVVGPFVQPPSSTARRIGVTTTAGNELVAGWVEAGSNELTFAVANISNIASSDGAVSWGTPAATGETSLLGVDMAPTSPGEGLAYIAWTGTDAAGTVNTGSVDVVGLLFGITLAAPSVLTEQGQTSESPCAVAGSKQASSSYVAWTGTNSTHSPNFIGPIGGGDAAQQYILGNDSAVGGPRLYFEDAAPFGSPQDNEQFYDPHLYMTWCSDTNGPAVNLLDVALGGMIGTKYVLPICSLCAPALLNFGGPGIGPWFMAWIDGATGQLALAASPGGNPNNWQQLTLYPFKPLNLAGISLAPLVATNQVLVAWVEGTDTDGFIIMGTVSANFMEW